MEQAFNSDPGLLGQSSDHYREAMPFRRPVGCELDDAVCGHLGWLGPDPASALASWSLSFSFLGSHLAYAQPNYMRQSMLLTPLTVMFGSKQRKLLVSAYLSTFIKWNKLFLNTRVANSLRGN